MRLSFRDPDGYVFRAGDRILRCVYPHAVERAREFLSASVAGAWMADGTLCRSTELEPARAREAAAEAGIDIPAGGVLLEHEPVPFPSYPYEWPPEMLHCAAELTLRLARDATSAGFLLKDATPYNLMYRGAKPVFIDVLSFERRDPLEVLWRPYAQFMRTFVYPLLASRYFGLRPDELLLVDRDGLVPGRILRMCPGWRLLLPPFLGAVTIPALLERGAENGNADRYRPRRARDAAQAGYVLEALFRRAERQLGEARVGGRSSEASRYMDNGHTYAAGQMAAKERFVEQTLARRRPARVLDIGSNTGHFSVLAAREGASVVALDHDAEALGGLWRTAQASGLDILPLLIDIARPPSGCGWANREQPAFLERARGRFDCVLMLALIHHLLVNERVSLEAIFELAASLTTGIAVVEYVDPSDAQFRRIARGRDELHREITRQAFEAAADRWFALGESWELTATRRIYALEKRA